MKRIVVLSLLLLAQVELLALDKTGLIKAFEGKHIIVLRDGLPICLQVEQGAVKTVNESNKCLPITRVSVSETGEVCVSLKYKEKPLCSKVRQLENGNFVVDNTSRSIYCRSSKKAMLSVIDKLYSKIDPKTKMTAEQYYQRAHKLYKKNHYQKALKLLLEAADFGHTKSEYRIGYLYAKGKGVDKDPDKARYWYLKAANKNHVPAQYGLGNLLRFDDPEEAVKWLKKAANSGHISAQNNLGWMYEMGHVGGWRNNEEAFRWYKMSADSGNKVGQYNVCVHYYKKGSHKYAEAEKWCQLSADQGYANAHNLLERIKSVW